MKKFIITNGIKGIILDAENADQARKIGNSTFYSPFENKKDLNIIQVYEEGKHLFVSVAGNKVFDMVQFHSMGGVTTTYNTNIDTKPTERQIKFLNRPIVYIKFFNGNYLK